LNRKIRNKSKIKNERKTKRRRKRIGRGSGK